MKASLLHFIRGSKVFDFNVRMMSQVMGQILILGGLIFLAIVFALLYLSAKPEMTLVLMNVYSRGLHLLGQGGTLVWQSGSNSLTADMFLQSQAITSALITAKALLMSKLQSVVLIGAVIFMALIVLSYRYFKRKGERLSEDKHISGTRLAKNAKETIASLKQSKRGISDISLLNTLPLPKRSEKQGILFHGSTGSGKSQAIMQLLEQLRASGDAVIVYDKECTLKPYFFNKETDVELNPISELCANWDIWEECQNPMELGSMATYLIPKSVQGSDPFWVDAARTILTSMAWKIKDRADKSIIVLLQLLLTTSLEEMRVLLKSSESANLVSKEIEKTAISIKSVLSTYTKALRFLEGLNHSEKPKFSIRKWIEQTTEKDYNKGWLFITSRSKYHKEIKPLISLWLGLAMQGIQSLPQDNNRRIWVVMDELASLHRLEMLSDTMADIRKFGGCVVVGVQSISQLAFLYQTKEAEAIADLLNNSVYFRSPSASVAKQVSDDIGKQVICEVKESRSYGPDSVRDGNTVGSSRSIRNTVEAGDIQQLEDLECYVRLLGPHPITKLQNKYIERPIVCESLTERSIDFDALEKIEKAALAIESNPDVVSDVKAIQNFEETADSTLKDISGEKGTKNDIDTLELREAPISHTKELA